MALKRQHDLLAVYSQASMTDCIFLLLIFFMISSTFVFPSALNVNLPQSSEQTAIKPSVRLYIDKDLKMYSSFDEKDPVELPADQLMTFLKMAQTTNPQQFIALYADEAVPYGKIVDILDKGSRNNLKIVLATKPASQQYAAPEPETQPATTAPTGGNQQPQQ
jgi:biopolymer transport protein ExbD